jgi:hypothetical protein
VPTQPPPQTRIVDNIRTDIDIFMAQGEQTSGVDQRRAPSRFP